LTGSVLGSLCSITDFGAEKLKVLVELNLLGPTFDSFTLGCASEGGGGVGTLFSFLEESLSPVLSISLICLFNGLLLLLLRSRTSGGIGLDGGDTVFFSSSTSERSERGVLGMGLTSERSELGVLGMGLTSERSELGVLGMGLTGAGVEVKLNTGILSTCNVGMGLVFGMEEMGGGGGTEERSGRLRPESVTLDFIFRLDFA